MRDRVNYIARAVTGGLWGGAVGGLAEVVLVASSAAELQEFGLVPFAVIGYAALGAVLGLCLGLAGQAIRPLRRRAALPWSAGLTVAALVIIVGRYHVNQRFFGEELSLSSASGVLAHIGLAALGALLGTTAWWAARSLGQRRLAVAAGLGGFILLGALALAVGRFRTASDTLLGRAPAIAAPQARPNVILIIADTLRADAVSGRGAAGERLTPAIDRLGADGVRFAHAFTQSSWTRPSIATILTSLHPSAHGATQKQSMLPDDVVTVAEVFREAGYWTAAFVSNINIAPVFNFHQGFVEYTYLPPSFHFGATDSAARLALYRMARLVRERFLAQRIYAANFYQDAKAVTDRAVAWIEAYRAQSPFFLVVHYMDPHDPYFEIPYNGRGVARVSTPDPPASRRDELHRLYLQNVGYLDEHLARLLGTLRERNLYDESVILFTSDHGEEFQEHRGWWHGTSLYEEQVHVPLIIKLPRGAQAGVMVDRPVQTLDISPTLLLRSGVAPPRSFAGSDLLSSDDQSRALVAEEDHEGNVLASVRLGRWKLITANHNNPRGLAPVELYDLEADPAERTNLAAKETQRMSDMLAALARERAAYQNSGSRDR